jgi:ribosomal-protein-alanine N-acetyltransferase
MASPQAPRFEGVALFMTWANDDYFLRSERIGFRCWRADDLPLAVALWGDGEVTRLIADLGRPSEEQARERLEREMANQAAFGVQYWPIFHLDGEHLGCCGLRPYRPDEGVFEIGAHLLPRHWRQGYATEAARCVVDHAFRALKLRAIYARHNPHNVSSRRLLLALGFQYTHDEFLPQTGLEHPAYLLRSPSDASITS